MLGLEPGASGSEIKKAYRTLSMQHHPDKNPQDPKGAADRMASINNAYEKLNEINKRRSGTSSAVAAGDSNRRKKQTKGKQKRRNGT